MGALLRTELAFLRFIPIMLGIFPGIHPSACSVEAQPPAYSRTKQSHRPIIMMEGSLKAFLLVFMTRTCKDFIFFADVPSIFLGNSM
jgi:hypothetical protein